MLPRLLNKTYISQIWSIVGSIQVPVAVQADTERITISVCENLNTRRGGKSIIWFAV